MEQLPNSITITVAALTVFLSIITALKYAIEDEFTRTRLIMTLFFLFIVATITISFWKYTLDTLPFTIPAWLLGALIGYLLGVRTEQAKLQAQGLTHYVQHFAHIHPTDFKKFTWWSVINFYSVMGALLLINLVGFSTVLYREVEPLAIATSVVGAFLLGTIAPYLLHLWSIKAPHAKRRTASEA
ncbi:MAG TPA: hypothetical protein VHD55_00960 [Candidatus Paceibacterota bacterium]|nr:hypothetical protein [Candidatus Paceibacterota bacterium]